MVKSCPNNTLDYLKSPHFIVCIYKIQKHHHSAQTKLYKSWEIVDDSEALLIHKHKMIHGEQERRPQLNRATPKCRLHSLPPDQ